MPRKIAIIFAAVILLILLLFLIGWRMRIRKIEHYLTGKYKEKFEFRYSFSEYLGNFRSQYLQIHWGDNAWSYPVVVTPEERPELKFTCFLGYGSLWDNYTYKCLAAELKPCIVGALPPDSGDYLLDIHISLSNFVESFDPKPTFAELKERQAQDSASTFPPVTITIVYKCGDAQNIEPILDRCIRIVQDKTSGTYTELGCFFAGSEEYNKLKANQARSPEFLYNHLWPAYKERGFPAFYIYSALPKDVLLKRKQRAVEAYQTYIK